jgi:hypothetical protein
MTRDTTVLMRLSTRLNSTFEYDKPAGSYDAMIFPVHTPVQSITFHHLIFSGAKAGTARAYGGTLANNWDLIVNGNLTIKDNASFGVVRGAAGQIRYARFRGNMTVQNSTTTLWFESTASMSFGWNVFLDGNTTQNITGDLVLLDSTTILNPAGINVNNRFEVKRGGFAAINPILILKNGIVNTLGAGIVFVNNNATGSVTGHAAGGSATAPSYINGLLKRLVTGTGSYDFPVGTASRYELCNVNFTAMTGVSNLTLSFLTTGLGTIPVGLPEGGDIYDQLLNGGFWRLTPNAAMTGGSYRLTLHETGHSQMASKYRVVKRANGAAPWALLGTHNSFTQGVGVVSASRNALTGFSDAAIAFPSALTLPIELVYFQAKKEDKKVRLNWQTASEINCQSFEIERSKDALHWTLLQQIVAKGHVDMLSDYLCYDEAPESGISYYRLKSNDIDAHFQYSEIVAVEMPEEGHSYLVYPNPTSDFIYIKTPKLLEGAMLYDCKGQSIPLCDLTKEGEANVLNMSNLPAGLYYLKIGEELISIVKQ